MSRKVCRDCGVEKLLDQFHPHPQMADGRHNYCIECYRRRNRERYHRRKGGDLRDNRRTRPLEPDGYRTCPDCGQRKPASEFAARRRASDGLHTYCRPCNNVRAYASVDRLHGSMRNRNMLVRYGLRSEQVDALIADQGGRCAICREKPAEHVDHDHATGEVRGLLCFTCNVGLGQLRDDLAVICNAALYLLRTLEPLPTGPLPERPTLPSGEPRSAPTGRSAHALRHVERKYGLSERRLAEMLEVQRGVCVICLTGPAEHVDHDHLTGAVRGILCSGCNTGLGSFGDDLDRVYGALNYLLAWDQLLAA
ncbi:endonuclease VII domain-containing protein [Pseudofrankia inefficax]|uniref:Recombination endonuclease VII n=1 Tax=Pseudofrankia inefficax (strain DSM 45817 / CECT 9037 / DDB 130130 / EuI1c) TaxID=298654 RepID=E3J2U7_PSEI1|nr:endonuclease VII domain-containing protein [Pseudofrankia inefficax]ADP81758.1 Recombination endonuclease VII [Pseudofrankia inefficax]